MAQHLAHKLAVISTIAFFLLLAFGSDSKDSTVTYKDGAGQIKHDSSGDWDQESTRKKIGEKVWKFCQDHPEPTSLFISIQDECTDPKGNVSKSQSFLFFNEDDLNEFETYKDDYSFTHNCMEFLLEIGTWQPCKGYPAG